MVPLVEACAECTQNCHVMHKKDKNPSPVATTFFKVMFGDDYSKVLFLPPKFARSVRNMVGKETRLEDSSGEKWTVKFTSVTGLLAFEEGWNKFSLDHGLKVGDFLVFHYIMESHFVVLMYGPSGCPELRHFGFTPHEKEKTRKKGKFIADDHSPTNVNFKGHHRSYESSSQSERSVYGVNEPCETGSTRLKKKRIRTDTTLPLNVDTTNAHHHLFASSSRRGPSVSDKEMSQRSEPLATNTSPDNMVSETPKIVKQLVDRDAGNVEDESRKSCLHDLSIHEIHDDKSEDGRKNDFPVGGGGDETGNNESGNVLETGFQESAEKPKESTMMRSEAKCNNSIKRRLRSRTCSYDLSIPEIHQDESDGGLKNDVPVRGSEDETQNNKSWKLLETRFEESVDKPKKSTVMPSEAKCYNSIKRRLRSANPPIKKTEKGKKELVGTSDKDDVVEAFHAKRMIVTKKDSDGCGLKDTETVCHNSLKEEYDDILPTVKPEPVDYDETPLDGASNTSFSAVMSSYQYLVLPKWVKLRPKVILLRNGVDLWPVLCQTKLGVNALTQSWEVFARERGILPGDECEFELESRPDRDGKHSCRVFRVHVTHK